MRRLSAFTRAQCSLLKPSYVPMPRTGKPGPLELGDGFLHRETDARRIIDRARLGRRGREDRRFEESDQPRQLLPHVARSPRGQRRELTVDAAEHETPSVQIVLEGLDHRDAQHVPEIGERVQHRRHDMGALLWKGPGGSGP